MFGEQRSPLWSCNFLIGTGIVGVAMALACARAVRLAAGCETIVGDVGSSSSINADIYMTDLDAYVDAARLTLLQNT